jgi:hypothetical protein
VAESGRGARGRPETRSKHNAHGQRSPARSAPSCIRTSWFAVASGGAPRAGTGTGTGPAVPASPSAAGSGTDARGVGASEGGSKRFAIMTAELDRNAPVIPPQKLQDRDPYWPQTDERCHEDKQKGPSREKPRDLRMVALRIVRHAGNCAQSAAGRFRYLLVTWAIPGLRSVAVAGGRAARCRRAVRIQLCYRRDGVWIDDHHYGVAGLVLCSD